MVIDEEDTNHVELPETLNTKQSDSNWVTDLEWIENNLKKRPVWLRNPTLSQKVLHEILPRWRRELTSEALNSPWGKIKKRIVKEFNEAEPFIEYVTDVMNKNEDETFTVVDLCSGFGILSMLLSELLPKHRVDKIWMIDKSFPLDFDKVESHHISVQHIVGKEWPIPLRIRKVNLKKKREIRNLHKHALKDNGTKVIIIGVHLCKSLSVHAINLYQSCPHALALLLKPCCLPGSRNLYVPVDGKTRPLQYDFGNGYSFRPIDLYDGEPGEDGVVKAEIETSSGDSVPIVAASGSATDGCNQNPNPRAVVPALSIPTELDESHEASTIMNPHQDKNCTNERFSLWINHLCRGCESDHCQVRVEKITTQQHHFQNQFIFCETIA